MTPLISCLTCTYGRFSRLTEMVSCFLSQNYENKELIILNTHPKKISTDLSDVKIINKTKYKTLGECRSAILEHANGDFIINLDDDDYYCPWMLSEAIENIKDFPAWKPLKSWFWYKGKPLELNSNSYESSILFRKDFVNKIGYKNSSGDEYEYLLQELTKHRSLKTDDLHILSPYIYTWNSGIWHISGGLGNGTTEERMEAFRENNQDTGDGVIKKIDIKPIFNEFNKLRSQWQNRQSEN